MSIERLVCTKVLGLKPRLVYAKGSREAYEVWNDLGIFRDGEIEGWRLEQFAMPNVLQDMNEAWHGVVSKMRKRGWTISLSNKGGIVTAYFYRIPNGKRPQHRNKTVREAKSEFAPEAIGIAALLALGVSKKDLEEARRSKEKP